MVVQKCKEKKSYAVDAAIVSSSEAVMLSHLQTNLYGQKRARDRKVQSCIVDCKKSTSPILSAEALPSTLVPKKQPDIFRYQRFRGRRPGDGVVSIKP